MFSLNPINLVSQVALAALTGGASIGAMLARQVLSAVGSQILQQLGDKLGLPQSAIDMAQGTFRAATGDTANSIKSVSQAVNDFGSAVGASNYRMGQAERGLNEATNDFVTSVAAKMKEMSDQSSETGAAKGAKNGQSITQKMGISGGFLVALAEALGKVLDRKMNDIAKVADAINEEGNKAVDLKGGKLAQNQSQIQSLGSVLNGISQEMKSLSDALNTALKTIGESQQGLARKG